MLFFLLWIFILCDVPWLEEPCTSLCFQVSFSFSSNDLSTCLPYSSTRKLYSHLKFKNSKLNSLFVFKHAKKALLPLLLISVSGDSAAIHLAFHLFAQARILTSFPQFSHSGSHGVLSVAPNILLFLLASHSAATVLAQPFISSPGNLLVLSPTTSLCPNSSLSPLPPTQYFC